MRREGTARGALRDPRTALVVLVVAGTGLGALLLGPGGHVGQAHGLVHSGVATALLAVAWPCCCLVAYTRNRRRIPFGADVSPVERRLVTAVRATLLAAGAGVPVLAAVLFWRGAPEEQPKTRRIVVGHPRAATVARPDAYRLPPWLEFAVLGLGVAVLVGAFAVVYLRLRAEYVRKPGRAPSGGGAAAHSLADAVASGRRALRDIDDARDAVIACYAAMEASLSDSGVARHASDSPNDLLVRAAAGGLNTDGSASALTELFREARYSTHPIGEDHRERAAAALEDIAEQLGAAGAGVGAGAGREATA